MSLRVLVAASSTGSGGAALAQKFARESGSEADIILAGTTTLPPGAWRRASLTGELAGPAAAEMLAGLLREADYAAVLFDDTASGRELAGRVAARCQLPAIGQAVGLRVARGELTVVRNADGGRKTAFIVPCHRPAIVVASATIGESTNAAGNARETISLEPPRSLPLLDLISETRLGPDEMELPEAEVVVAGGRGVGSREGFEMLEELAGLLGGTVGASRVAVDAGWAPYRRQVGLTGKTVAPRLYVACGISGAPHHVLGMRNSSLIVAINSDPQAPIFRIAHVAVLGKVEQVVPELISEIQSRRATRRPELQAAAR